MDVTFNAVVSHQGDGLTLYAYLDGYFPFIDDNDWATRLLVDATCIDGSLVSGNPLLRLGQQLSFSLNHYSEEAVDTGWQLLWQDAALFAVHKPANLPVHRTTRNVYNTLTALVRRESDWPDAQLLHRLDQETAGIVLFAKNNAQAKVWQPKFHTLVTQKIYQALVYGSPNWSELEVTNKLAVRADSPIRCQMHICLEGEQGKTSTTRIRVVERRGAYSLVECELVTGRKHQIRAHLAHLGHAIVGDKIYAHQGEYYLHRLANSLTPLHRQQLLSPHQLLIAHRVTLQLSDGDQVGPVVIVDDHYPAAWQGFLAGLADPSNGPAALIAHSQSDA
ncbi:RluA family pseudouridine synthase [Reinekea sp.]|jgi:23S rRNA pseudouridine1911/1915/1917 synthase|uniref:RluA family pseudouridine synthase n=1 Tax=Reinekea sp. TaxID=1970455 RepID=UPI002A822E85|nr:RluA family pseudouridine synthase [Reinekea sp.]